jgi:hypothetical protein
MAFRRHCDTQYISVCFVKGKLPMLKPDDNFPLNDLTQKILGAAIEVHRNLGPGLLESAYERCLAYELE